MIQASASGGWRGAGGAALRSLVKLPPNPGPRWAIALRTSLGVALPLTVATAFGHQEIGLLAAGGAFTGIYGSALNTKERIKMLPFAFLLLFFSAVAGTILAPWKWGVAVGLVAVTIIVCAVSYAFRFGPPGPVFAVLLFGLSANITGVTNGVRHVSPWLYLGMFIVGGIVSYLLSISPILTRSERAAKARPLSEILPGPWLGPGERVLLIRVAIVAVAGLIISMLWLDPTRAYWTVASGVTVVGLVAVRSFSFTRGLHRTVGTILGALLFFAIAPLGAYPWVLVVLLFVLQYVIEFIVIRNYALAFVFVTPLVLFINEVATRSTDMTAVAQERIVDTIVGSVLAMLTVFVHGVRKADPSEAA